MHPAYLHTFPNLDVGSFGAITQFTSMLKVGACILNSPFMPSWCTLHTFPMQPLCIPHVSSLCPDRVVVCRLLCRLCVACEVVSEGALALCLDAHASANVLAEIKRR